MYTFLLCDWRKSKVEKYVLVDSLSNTKCTFTGGDVKESKERRMGKIESCIKKKWEKDETEKKGKTCTFFYLQT